MKNEFSFLALVAIFLTCFSCWLRRLLSKKRTSKEDEDDEDGNGKKKKKKRSKSNVVVILFHFSCYYYPERGHYPSKVKSYKIYHRSKPATNKAKI